MWKNQTDFRNIKSYPLCKKCQISGFLKPISFRIRTEFTILFWYWRIRIREDRYSRIFYTQGYVDACNHSVFAKIMNSKFKSFWCSGYLSNIIILMKEFIHLTKHFCTMALWQTKIYKCLEIIWFKISKFAKSRAMRTCMQAWSRWQRACVPKACQILIFTCQRANKRANLSYSVPMF